MKTALRIAPSIDSLKEILNYCPDSGEFRWKKRIGFKAVVGQLAGSYSGGGYLYLSVLGYRQLAHRMAFAFQTGAWPEGVIDHIDGDPGNNKWSNLRDVPEGKNRFNLRRSKTNSSGTKGVSKCSTTGKWRARIRAHGEEIDLGRYAESSDAAKVYILASKRVHGEHARMDADKVFAPRKMQGRTYSPRTAKVLPDVAELSRLFNYDPETGVLSWKAAPSFNTSRIGSEAGTLRPDGYREVRVNGRLCLTHRIAWAITAGSWPVAFLDHVNRDRSDNRLVNIREASASQNQSNKGVRKDSRSGVKGVTWHPALKKWRAIITHNGKRISLGCFLDIEDAGRAFIAASKKVRGEFSEG